MNLLYLRTLYCKSRMVAYVNGELPPAARRRIARYIERYPTCYAEYIRQREAARELHFRLPLVGQPERATLDRIWNAVQVELEGSSAPQIRRLSQRSVVSSSLSFRVRYGVLGLVMAVSFALPLTFSVNHTAFAVSLTQPIPMTATGLPTEEKQPVVLIAESTDLQSVKDQTALPAPALPQATAISTEEK